MDYMFKVLDNIHSRYDISKIIHGGASGADTLAGMWGYGRKVDVKVYHAKWDKYGNKAGFIRNQQMLDKEHPDMVIGFTGGKGTRDMLARAINAGVKKIIYDKEKVDTYIDGLPIRTMVVVLPHLYGFTRRILTFYQLTDLVYDHVSAYIHGDCSERMLEYNVNFALFRRNFRTRLYDDIYERDKLSVAMLPNDIHMEVSDLINEYDLLLNYLETSLSEHIKGSSFIKLDFDLPNSVEVMYE